jgi:hypothetical protein
MTQGSPNPDMLHSKLFKGWTMMGKNHAHDFLNNITAKLPDCGSIDPYRNASSQLGNSHQRAVGSFVFQTALTTIRGVVLSDCGFEFITHHLLKASLKCN